MRRDLEIAAVLLAAVVHYVLVFGVGVHGLDVAPIGIGAIVYAVVRGRDPATRAEWGLHAAGLRSCALAATWFAAVGIVVCATIGVARGTFVFDPKLPLLFLLYPLWGVVQQFLVLSLFANNLDARGLPRAVVLAIATAGFAGVHVPNWPLCAATAVLGFIVTWLFFRHRNLWPLGIAHGVLAAVFYRWVLARDVWSEFLRTRA